MLLLLICWKLYDSVEEISKKSQRRPSDRRNCIVIGGSLCVLYCIWTALATDYSVFCLNYERSIYRMYGFMYMNRADCVSDILPWDFRYQYTRIWTRYTCFICAPTTTTEPKKNGLIHASKYVVNLNFGQNNSSLTQLKLNWNDWMNKTLFASWTTKLT